VQRQHSSQLQKCKAVHKNSEAKHTQHYDRAVHNRKNIRLSECLVELQSSRDGMRLGWRTPRVDSVKLAKLHNNW